MKDYIILFLDYKASTAEHVVHSLWTQYLGGVEHKGCYELASIGQPGELQKKDLSQ